MAKIRGFRLVRLHNGGVYHLRVLHGMISHRPNKKYRYEKVNAFDPTMIHRSDPYYEDVFDLEAVVQGAEYYDIIQFINAPGDMYLEFTLYGGVSQQYPVVVQSQPECPDDLHEFPEKIKMSFLSRYVELPSNIDFTGIAFTDTDEIVID